ncbi:hypothetical protein CAPTEDRAFT_193171 [Capitella teleta]|uniref:Uncharacterized protein n=1 Tax=Capitella teleta TaxID=283909 RepID=R7UNJ6_CAPTE|nr:hypothetical protein CAPTEDRAFT_193171 [Capitella teleta]|eukprot:ELU07800.1 hypothetical protein CAPTEDRAFT_193171 [Capitella teleta]
MAFNQALVFSAILCCAAAFPDFLFPNLQTLRTNALQSGRVRRAVLQVGDLSPEEKCDKMAAAFQDLVTTVHAHVPAEHIGEIREQILQSSGLDISNPDHIREEACKYTDATTLAEMAERVEVPEEVMRQMYPHIVEGIQMIRGILRDAVSNPWVPPEYKNLLSACLRFYDVMAEIGMLDLE